MRIYLASRYGRRQELAEYATMFKATGHEVTSRWRLGTHEASDGDSSRWGDFAQDDLDDIQHSDLLVAFTESQMFPRGSRHVELGIALGLGLRVIVVGPLENVFCYLPGIIHYDTWADFATGWLRAFAPAELEAVR